MKVEIWSDVACPWCYIGKRRFETALAEFEHRDQVEVIWRSYQLDPHAPPTTGTTVNEILARKYGLSPEQAAHQNERVSALAAQEGLEYHLDRAQYGNTFDAHRLIHLAAAHNVQHEAEERFFRAYFTEGRALGDAETLVELIAEVGIAEEDARATLRGDTYADAVRADEQQARAYGIQGVPFFAIDERYGVSGAQPAQLFKDVLEQAWAASHTLMQVGGTSPDEDAAETCDGETCAPA